VLVERAATKLRKLQEEEITKMMNFPIFIRTEKQRERQKKADLKARKRELTPWQIANITREKEQRLLLVQELPFEESPKSTSPTKSPAKSPAKSPSNVKDSSSPSKQPKRPKQLSKAPYLPPPQPQLQPKKTCIVILTVPATKLTEILSKAPVGPPVLKSSRGRTLKPAAKLRQ